MCAASDVFFASIKHHDTHHADLDSSVLEQLRGVHTSSAKARDSLYPSGWRSRCERTPAKRRRRFSAESWSMGEPKGSISRTRTHSGARVLEVGELSWSPMSWSVTVDTNILLYAANTDDDLHGSGL